jgi:hypothetical protein
MMELKSVSNNVVGELHPPEPPKECAQVTINLLDPDLVDVIERWRTHCGEDKIGRLICEGPLAGQEPLSPRSYKRLDGLPWIKQLLALTNMSHVVEIPSIAATNLMSTMRFVNSQVNVEELVFLEPMYEERSGLIEHSAQFFANGSLTVQRWVFRLKMLPDEVESVNILIQSLAPRTNMYLVLESPTEEALRVATLMNVRKYIIDEQYKYNKSDMLAVFLDTAEDVIYRQLYPPGDPMEE